MAAPYILARTLKEAHSYARETLGLAHGHYRVVNGVGTLKSVRGAELHLVPNWQNRYDRFAMKSAIRWTRMTVIDVAERQAEAPVDEPDGLEPAGVQPTLDAGDHTDFFANVMISEGGPATPEVTPEPEAKAPEAKNRRRRRCKECGILVEPDEVDSHAEDHKSDLVAEVS